MSSQGCNVEVTPEAEAAPARSLNRTCLSCGLQLSAQVLEWRETLAKLSSTYELLTSDSNALCKLMRNLPVLLYYCGPSACPLPVQEATIMLAHVADDALRPVSVFMAPIVSLCTGSLKSAGELNELAEHLWGPFPGGLDETLLAPYLDILDDYLQERIDRDGIFRNRDSNASPSNVGRIQPLSTWQCIFDFPEGTVIPIAGRLTHHFMSAWPSAQHLRMCCARISQQLTLLNDIVLHLRGLWERDIIHAQLNQLDAFCHVQAAVTCKHIPMAADCASSEGAFDWMKPPSSTFASFGSAHWALTECASRVVLQAYKWRPSFEMQGQGGFIGWPTEEGKHPAKSWLKEPLFFPKAGCLGQPRVVQDNREALGYYFGDGCD